MSSPLWSISDKPSVFDIPELVQIVSDHLGQPDLECIGRVHPIFHAIALDRHWRDLVGFSSLFVNMHQDLVAKSKCGLARLPTPEERELVQGRASRVRSFQYSWNMPFSMRGMELFAFGTPPASIFPTLQLLKLSLRFHSAGDVHCASALLGASIWNLELRMHVDNESPQQPFLPILFLQAVSLKSNNIRDLTVVLTTSVKPVAEEEALALDLECTFVDLLHSLSHLKCFKLQGFQLGVRSLNKLASSTVEKFRIEEPKAWVHGATANMQTDHHAFGSLTALTLVNIRIALAVPWFETVTSPKLCRLSISTTELSKDALRRLCHISASRWPSLLSVSFEACLSSSVRPVLDMDPFSPLLSCHSMENFGVLGTLMFEVDDAVVAAIAQAWPRLRSLYLVEGVPGLPAVIRIQPLRTTFAALLSLATSCPDLSYLGLSVNFNDLDEGLSDIDTRTPPCSLTGLDLGVSTVPEELPRIAALLRALFPCLQTLDWTKQAPWVSMTTPDLTTPDLMYANVREVKRFQRVQMLNGYLGTALEGTLGALDRVHI